MRIPVAKEGAPFILVSFAVTIAAFLVGLTLLGFVLLPLAVFVLAFFRDPERVVPDSADAIVSPADGRVIKVERVNDDRLLKDQALKISIFMNLFSVHVNRVPASGRVVNVIYNPGKFLNASFDKASLENEQNAVILKTPEGRTIAFNQIAGLIARRIVCYARSGDTLVKGERFGLIRFGSRLDVYLPVDCRASVKVGDHVSAGSSVLASWS